MDFVQAVKVQTVKCKDLEQLDLMVERTTKRLRKGKMKERSCEVGLGGVNGAKDRQSITC